MNCNLPTFQHNAIHGQESDHSGGRWLGPPRMDPLCWTFEKVQQRLLRKSNSLFPIQTNANSPTATPSEHDFVGEKKALQFLFKLNL